MRNFKGTLWNSTQNILSIHWNIQFLYNIDILRALRFKSSYEFLKRPPELIHALAFCRPQLWLTDVVTFHNNTLKHKNGYHFTDDHFKWIFTNEIYYNLLSVWINLQLVVSDIRFCASEFFQKCILSQQACCCNKHSKYNLSMASWRTRTFYHTSETMFEK